MKYQRKEFLAVDAQQYDGSFELAFLRPDEQVYAGKPNGESVKVRRVAQYPNRDRTVEIEKGQWVVRLRDGSICVMDDSLFREEYEAAPVPVDEVIALCRANADTFGNRGKGSLRGAPSHSGAALVTAWQDLGLRLVRIPTGEHKEGSDAR